MNKIIVIAIVAVLLVGGGAGAYYAMSAGNDGSHSGSDNGYFNFKDCHFDLSGAQSLLIAEDSIVGNTSSMIAASKSTDSMMICSNQCGVAMMPFGDESTAANDYSLYKTDEYGNYIKVLLYGNDVQSGENGETDENSKALDFDMTPVSMEISDDGKYILLGYCPSNQLWTNTNTGETYANVIYIVVTVDTGKVYQLNDQPMYTTLNSQSNTGYLYDYYGNVDCYKIIGTYDSKLMLRTWSWSNVKYLVAYVENDELVVKETLTSKIISNLGQQYCFYNYGITRCSITNQNESYLVAPDGGLAQFENSYIVYGNNLCTAITYYDEDTKFFASSYDVITGINLDTGNLITQHVDLTKNQSYQMAIKNVQRNEVYKKTDSDGTTVYVMEAKNTLYKYRLNANCTVTKYSNAAGVGRFTLPFSLEKTGTSGMSSIADDTQVLEKYGDFLQGYYYTPYMGSNNAYLIYYGYFVYNGHISQAYTNTGYSDYGLPMGMTIGDIVVSNGTLYKLSSGGTLTSYNIETGASDTYSIAKVVRVQSMDIVNDIVVIKGIVANGSVMTGSLDLSTGMFDSNYSKVLAEVRLKALN